MSLAAAQVERVQAERPALGTRCSEYKVLPPLLALRSQWFLKKLDVCPLCD